MSNLAIERIMSQTATVVPTPADEALKAMQNTATFSAIELVELRQILRQELCPTPILEPAPVSENVVLHFDSIYDFTQWYIPNKKAFSVQQRTALDTVEHARGMIDAGCACKRSSREVKAHQYFEQFWLNNRDTDLLPTIANIVGANRVSVNHYCAYTR